MVCSRCFAIKPKLTFLIFQVNGLAAQGKYVSSGTGGAAGQSLYVANHAY